MHTRTLGNTGLRVSAIGLGSGILGSSETAYGVHLVQRALDLGMSFIDTARGYGDAEIKIGLALEGQRERAAISTKTAAKTRADAWRDINESLERLRTDYVDNCHLHGLESSADIAARLGPGGALEALIEAKSKGLIRHIGCTSHRSDLLMEALERFAFEIILVPMNIVEREPLAQLIPLCHARGVGVTIMKPVATGLLPATLALRWLLNQPVDCVVPGVASLAELEEDALAGYGKITLSPAEQARVQEIKDQLEHVRCRICGDCLPCPLDIDLPFVLGADVMYDHYRNMGRERFGAFAWPRAIIERDLAVRHKRIAAIDACTHCGDCEKRCRYGLPVIDMLHSMAPAMKDMVGIYNDLLR